MIKAVLFDMDGLMFDTETAYSIVHSSMSKKRGVEFTNEIKTKLMGKRAYEVMSLLNNVWGKNETIDSLLAEQDCELIKTYNTSVSKLEGLDDLISFLKDANIRLCICTSSRRFLVDILLDKHKLTQTFEYIVSGDMVKEGKPNPEIYNTCISYLKISSEECLVFEDSLNGVRAGIAAGCSTIAVPSIFTRHEDFSIATLIVNSLNQSEVINYIKSKNAKTSQAY